MLDNTDHDIVRYIVLLGFTALTLMFNEMLAFAGIAVYSMVLSFFKDKKKLVFVGLLVCGLSVCLLKNKEFFYVFYIILSYFISIIMAVKTRNILDKSIEVWNVRDDSAAKNNALTIENKYLLENRQNEIYIATLKERNRIAREIHDNVGHLLSRSILQVGALIAVNKDTKVEKQLLAVKNTLDDAMNSIRESVHDLHKDSFDLKAAAESVLFELHGFEISFEYDMSKDMDKNVKYMFITVLKEAITNIEKHSDADKVTVIMRELERYYQLLIEDNGSNTPGKDEKIMNEGIGLLNMEERVKSLSGIINFSFENGFRIFISIPKEVK